MDTLTGIWADIVAAARAEGPFLGQALSVCRVAGVNQPVVALELTDADPGMALTLERQKDRAASLLSRVLGAPVVLDLVGSAVYETRAETAYRAPRPRLEAPSRAQRDYKAEYREYLATDKWKLRRDLAVERDRTCVICHSSQNLEVHHRTYELKYNEPLYHLTTLCHECHTAVTTWQNARKSAGGKAYIVSESDLDELIARAKGLRA
jgi:5-methylcytosine-specific restriction endonuclease McrA